MQSSSRLRIAGNWISSNKVDNPSVMADQLNVSASRGTAG